jgi:hypothetical protein
MACIFIPTEVVGAIKIILIGLFFSSVCFIVTFYFCRQYIMDNWSKYKCNPLILPCATMFGQDPGKTLQECLGMQNFAMASSMMMPMTGVLGSITGALDNASGLIGDLDFVSTSTTSLFGNGFSKILGQLGNIGSAIQYLIIKIQTVLQRLIATVAVIMFSMSSLLQGLLAIKRDTGLQRLIDKVLAFPSM